MDTWYSANLEIDHLIKNVYYIIYLFMIQWFKNKNFEDKGLWMLNLIYVLEIKYTLPFITQTCPTMELHAHVAPWSNWYRQDIAKSRNILKGIIIGSHVYMYFDCNTQRIQ